jgi:LPXTG-motif cell wall-anchored protein
VSRSILSTTRVRRIAGATAFSAVMLLGVGSASAQDQHSGGVSPNNQSRDPGTEVLGNTVTRGGGLPVTGSDVAGMVAIGAVAVAAGAGAVTASKRRSARLSA